MPTRVRVSTHLAARLRQRDRAIAAAVDKAHVGAAAEQQAHDLLETAARGVHERRAADAILHVGAAPRVEEARDRRVVRTCRHGGRRGAAALLGWRRDSTREQQRCEPALIGRVARGAVREE